MVKVKNISDKIIVKSRKVILAGFHNFVMTCEFDSKILF